MKEGSQVLAPLGAELFDRYTKALERFLEAPAEDRWLAMLELIRESEAFTDYIATLERKAALLAA